MDDPRPSSFPDGWDELCRDVPALREQIGATQDELHQIALYTVQMDDRHKSMAANIAELANRQMGLQSQITTLADQMREVLDAMRALGGTPSGFVGLARDVGGSVRMTRRIFKWALGAATTVAALYGAFHLGESKGAQVEPPPAPDVSVPQDHP